VRRTSSSSKSGADFSAPLTLMRPGTRYTLEVNPRIPKRLARLEELAANLWYSWDRPTRALFARLNPSLWDAVGHSPKAMLKRIDEQKLLDAAADPAFLDSLGRVLAAFDAYQAEAPFSQNGGGFRPGDLVAYFCAEFGVHESLPTYSGGLGILAGDHCKAASDFQHGLECLPLTIAMRSVLVVCSRPGVSLEPRGGTACPSHPAASLASDIRYVKYCGTESSRCLILWSSHSQTLLTQATNQEDKRICFPIVMRMRRSAQP